LTAINWLIIALAALGPLLVSLLWLPRGSRSRRLALAAYTFWLMTSTITPVGLIAGILLAVSRLSRLATSDVSWSAGWGLLPLAAGLLLGWTAAILLLGSRDPVESSTPVPRAARERSRRQIVGALVFAAGAVVWGGGFLAVPWATVNCAMVPLSLNHFVEGACAGLDAGDALSALVASRVEPTGWDWYNGIYTLYGLLLGGGVLALVVIWRGAFASAPRLWLATWLLVASIVTALCYRGVAHIAAEAPVLAIQATGVWRGAPGIPLAFSGLVLAWLGLLLLDGTTQDTSLPAPASQNGAVPLFLSADASPAPQ
jgi:hypothetical protein